jgi:hypothetical protein
MKVGETVCPVVEKGYERTDHRAMRMVQWIAREQHCSDRKE